MYSITLQLSLAVGSFSISTKDPGPATLGILNNPVQSGLGLFRPHPVDLLYASLCDKRKNRADVLAEALMQLRTATDAKAKKRIKEIKETLLLMEATRQGHLSAAPGIQNVPGSVGKEVEFLVLSLREEQEFPLGKSFLATSPAGRLIKIGRPAIPFLLRAINDKSFSRCKLPDYRHSRWYMARVGDFAASILQSITGEQFLERYYLFEEDECGRLPVVEVARKARSWWARQELHEAFRVAHLQRLLRFSPGP